MGHYNRTKLAIDAFRGLASKSIRFPAKPSTPNRIPFLPLPRKCEPTTSNYPFQEMGSHGFDRGISGKKSINGFSFTRLLSRSNDATFLSYQSKRFYYVDGRRVQHFRARGPRRWFQNPRMMLAIVLVSGGAIITVYFGNLETIPYSHRSHFVLLSRGMEKQLGERQFEEVKAAYKGKLLPAIHPDSVRVRLISKDIIDALQRGLRYGEGWSNLQYASEKLDASETSSGSRETLAALTSEENPDWHREDEILDDNWVQQSRKTGRARGSQPALHHLEGLNWEVVVVNEPVVNAFCLPGGKIVVFTGLLNQFKSDAEIATVIGHEIGHCIARHGAEEITKNLWFTILQLVLLQFVSMPDLVNAMSHLLLKLPFSRRMEMEADYIGLLLLASAGYDPRVAIGVYEKLEQLNGESALRNYLSTHPSGKKRAQLLSQAKVMEEALSIYRESTAGRGVEGFL